MKSTTHALRRLIAFVALGFLFAASASAVHVDVTVNDDGDALHRCAVSGSGDCTLRDAITFSNANPPTASDRNNILFDIPGAGVHSIRLTSDLPSVATPTVIDGYSQPGASQNTLTTGDDANLLVELTQCVDPHDCSANTALLTIDGGPGSIVQGLAIDVPFFGDFTLIPSVVPLLVKSDSCKVAGNFIGTDPSGTLPEIGGVDIESSGNVIGGATPAERNVISGLPFTNADGANLLINGQLNLVEGNYVGTDATGMKSLSTIDSCTPVGGDPCLVGPIGIKVPGSLNVIGGSATSDRNVISGNIGGVAIAGNQNFVEGNFVGLGADGLASLGNGVPPSVDPASGIDVTGFNNVVGGGAGGTGNVIAFNNPTGVVVDGGVGNAILQNSIFSNIGLGIQLGSLTSPLPNDPGDTDSGPNDLQNYPVLTDALALKKNTSVTGTLNSAPNQAYRVELFANGACDPSGSGEGMMFLTAIPVATDGSGNGSFSAKLSLADAPPGTFITSTATGPSLESPLGETSEFSACVLVHPAPSPTKVRVLVEGPIRVAPGVPVEFPIQVEAKKVAGDLTGEAIVSDDAGHVCRTPVSPEGDGACSLTFGSPGKFKVHAEYLGNGLYDGSTSPAVNVKVKAAGAP